MEPVKTVRIFLAAIAANISSFAAGTTAGWTSPILPKLKLASSPLGHPTKTTDDALINSLIAVGAIPGPILAGFLADRIGRKMSLLLSSVFFGIGFLLMLVAKKVWVILLGRLLHGFGMGFVLTIQPIYAGEIATNNSRGALGSLIQLFILLGILYIYAIGPFLPYNASQYFCLAIPIVFVLVFIFMPESPYFYAAKGKDDKALKSLQFLRGQSASTVQDELTQIKKNIEESLSNKGTIGEIFRVPGNRKAFFIALGLIAFQHLSGINALLFNTQMIFESGAVFLDPPIAAIIVAIVQVASSTLTPTFADRIGRKVILLISVIIMTIALTTLGCFFYIKDRGYGSSKVNWLPILALVIYNIAYFLGYGPITWAILGEIFSTNIKSHVISLIMTTSWILCFLVLFFYPFLNDIGLYYTFWIFAIFCFIAILFIIFVVIETKGLSLLEIQDRLSGKNL